MSNRELALINGTLREEEHCSICGQKGHRQFECTNRKQSYEMANVRCRICGDASHVTKDCRFNASNSNSNPNDTKAALDNEYMNFMSELEGGGNKPSPPAPTPTQGVCICSIYVCI